MYTTIHYSVGSYAGFTCIKLNKVSVRSKLLDSTCRITLTCARGGYSGYNLATDRFVDDTSNYTCGTQDASRSISCPPLELTDGGVRYEIWGEGKTYVHRGDQSWTISHIVRENGMGSPL